MADDNTAPDCLLDALNIAWWCGAPPSLRLPLAIARGLIRAGKPPLLVFDASTRHQLPETEHAVLAGLLDRPQLALQVASGEHADGVLLAQAKAVGGIVISRDRFRDHRRKYRAIVRNPERRIDGFVSDDVIRVPALSLAEPLPATAAAAWRDVLAVIGDAPAPS